MTPLRPESWFLVLCPRNPWRLYVFNHSLAWHAVRQTKLLRVLRFQGSGTGVPPVRIVQPTHGRDAGATRRLRCLNPSRDWAGLGALFLGFCLKKSGESLRPIPPDSTRPIMNLDDAQKRTV